MSSQTGKKLNISVFGESHGEAVGVVINGLPAGVEIDFDGLLAFMKRRAPGGRLATPRKEEDKPRFLSGVFNGVTTGFPLCAVIENTNTRSSDYKFANTPRPSHADFTAAINTADTPICVEAATFRDGLQLPSALQAELQSRFLHKKGFLSAHI